MAAAYLDIAYGCDTPATAVMRRHEDRWARVVSVARNGVNAPMTSSAGRLFDAVSAILSIRDSVNYEGQAAIELEQRTDVGEPGRYAMTITDSETVVLAGADLVRAVVEELSHGVSRAVIAARFHNGLVDGISRACDLLRDRTGVTTAALSGGVFQNMLLLERTVQALSDRGFRVLTHSRIPPNDGGISLGQAVIAAAQEQR
jgi:hydrogenase maturation protein HypF